MPLDRNGNGRPDAGTIGFDAAAFGLHGGVPVDPNTEAASFYGSANADLAIAGALAGDPGTAVGGFKYPSVRADFRLGWDLGGADARTGDVGRLGAAGPRVALQNVRVGFGDYLTTVLAPLTTAVQTYLMYYEPYLDVVGYEIPELTSTFTAAGLRTTPSCRPRSGTRGSSRGCRTRSANW